MKKISLGLIFLILIVGCSCPDLDTSIKTLYFDRLFMNEDDRYTVITNGRPVELRVGNANRVAFKYDIKEGKKYVRYQKKCNGGTAFIQFLEFHLDRVEDINGGGWNHGKFGKGQTNLIQ